MKFINGVTLFLPIVIFIFYFLDYKFEKIKNYTDFIEYLSDLTDDSKLIIILSIIVYLITVISNIVFISTSYMYQIKRHYLSFTFIMTSLFILLIGIYIDTRIIELSNIIWLFKCCKIERKINSLVKKEEITKELLYLSDEQKEEILKTINQKIEKYKKDILDLTIFYMDEVKISKKQ